MQDQLLNYSLEENPLNTFLSWYEDASKVEQNAQAMAVSTHDQEKNRPNCRYLLYKGIVQGKILFYTHYTSPKFIDLETNPEIALTFYWHVSKKQVRIHGKALKLSAPESAKYFHSRDRDSQIASYISHQSEEIESKELLIKKFNEAREKFNGLEIPAPANWGGVLVDPYEYEFFLYGENRLNDRFLYELQNKKWQISRLQP